MTDSCALATSVGGMSAKGVTTAARGMSEAWSKSLLLGMLYMVDLINLGLQLPEKRSKWYRMLPVYQQILIAALLHPKFLVSFPRIPFPETVKLNGSGQESCNRHFDWNFQVCQNPHKLCKPTCVMWKDVPVLFFPKSRKTWQTGLKFSLPTHPTVFCRLARGFSYLVYPNSAFFRRKGAIGGGGGCGGGVERELQACLSSLFFLLLGKNNTGTSFQITQVSSQSLGGFWHTCKFQSKWWLRDSCPEPFNYEEASCVCDRTCAECVIMKPSVANIMVASSQGIVV